MHSNLLTYDSSNYHTHAIDCRSGNHPPASVWVRLTGIGRTDGRHAAHIMLRRLVDSSSGGQSASRLEFAMLSTRERYRLEYTDFAALHASNRQNYYRYAKVRVTSSSGSSFDRGTVSQMNHFDSGK